MIKLQKKNRILSFIAGMIFAIFSILSSFGSGFHIVWAEEVDDIILDENKTATEETSVEEIADEPMEILPSHYDGDGYSIDFCIGDSWSGGYNATVIITNCSDSAINNWSLYLPVANEINNIWNATIQEQADGFYIIKNNGWNQNIPANSSVDFGFTANGDFTEYPNAYNLISQISVVTYENYSITYHLQSDWGDGFVGEIHITNVSLKDIEGWTLEFDFPREIQNLWNGVVKNHEGNHYEIVNSEYNATLKAGETIVIGFEGVGGTLDNEPDNYVVIHHKASEADRGISIDFSDLCFYEDDIYLMPSDVTDLHGEMLDVENITEAYYVIKNPKGDIVKQEDINISDLWEISNISLLVGTNAIEVIVHYLDGEEKKAAVVLGNFDADKMEGLDIDLSDTDCDGLSNYLEYIYDTDPLVTDTDGDGISDYDEVWTLGTNPLMEDTDEDGTLDGRDDLDEDNILTIDELQYGTSPFAKDSDGDLLTDYEELFTYNTDPNNSDTDSDGADDQWEIEHGYDPLTYNNFFSISESLDNGDLNYSIDLKVKGEQIATFVMDHHEMDIWLNSTIPGFLGKAVDFSLNGTFEEAVLNVEFDEDYLQIESFNPTIYYFNEENQILEEITTEWDGESNHVTAALEHFSTYILLNKTDFDTVWEEEFDKDNTGAAKPLKVVLTIDSSGSMQSNDPKNLRLSVAKEFVSKFEDIDKAAVISFDQYVTTRCGFTNDKQTLYNAISKVGNNGNWTYIGKALTQSLSLFVNDEGENETTNYIILLTDGLSHDTITNYQTICNEYNIKVYTIGLGSGVDKNLLTKIANETGGKYYFASVATDLEDIFYEIEDDISDEEKRIDSNNDGISDYYTQLICSGKLLTGTKTNVFEGVRYDTIQKNNDYDEDGLKNGEEIEIVKATTGLYVKVISNPKRIDSDWDGFTDYQEVKRYGSNPLLKDIFQTDVKVLTYDDAYLSSIYSEALVENSWLQFQIYAGNALMNKRMDIIGSYGRALYGYIEIMNEGFLTPYSVDNIKYQFGVDIEETASYLNSWVGLLSEIPNDTLNIGTYSAELEAYMANFEILYKRLMDLDNINDATGVMEDIIIQKTKIQAKYWTISNEFNREIAKLDKTKISGKLAERLGNIMYRLPDGVQTSINVSSSVSQVGSYVFVGIETTTDAINTIKLFSVINSQNMNYDFANTMLNSIICYSKNTYLVLSASDLNLVLMSKKAEFVSNSIKLYNDIQTGGIKIGLLILAEDNPYIWAVELGLTLGDLVFRVGNLDTLSIKTFAYGDAAVCLSKSLLNSLEKDTDLFYILDDNSRVKMQVLCQIRIVGENSFYETSKARPWFIELYQNNQTEATELCIDHIQGVYRISKKYYLYASPYYNGHSLDI